MLLRCLAWRIISYVIALRRAQKVLTEVFTDRKVVAVPSREILLGGGNIHCITQQQPAADIGSV